MVGVPARFYGVEEGQPTPFALRQTDKICSFCPFFFVCCLRTKKQQYVQLGPL